MTHTFNLNGRAVRLIVSREGKKYKKATGLTIDPSLWNQKARSLRAKCKDVKVYERLRLIDLRMTEKEADGGVSPDEAINYAIHGENAAESPENGPEKEKGAGVSFYEYFDEWANRDTPQRRQRRNTLKLIRECMGDSWDWADIDTAFFFRLVQKLKARDYSVNYIGSIAKKLKTVMSEGYKLKYHANTDFHQFSAPMEQATTVWLTPDEVRRILDLKLTDRTEKKVQDLFTLGYYTAMRFSDYSRLSMDNIKDGKIYLAQKKTAGMVIIPASPRVVAVLKRNGGEAPSLTQEAFNRIIKVLAMRAGINDRVLVVRSKGNGHTEEMVEKWSQIASHSCRRSAITALHISGVPLHQLRLISGHKDIQSLQRYLRMTKEENAEALKSNSFFL